MDFSFWALDIRLEHWNFPMSRTSSLDVKFQPVPQPWARMRQYPSEEDLPTRTGDLRRLLSRLHWYHLLHRTPPQYTLYIYLIQPSSNASLHPALRIRGILGSEQVQI